MSYVYQGLHIGYLCPGLRRTLQTPPGLSALSLSSDIYVICLREVLFDFTTVNKTLFQFPIVLLPNSILTAFFWFPRPPKMIIEILFPILLPSNKLKYFSQYVVNIELNLVVGKWFTSTVILHNVSQSMFLRPEASALPGNLLEMQIFCPVLYQTF